MSGTNVARKTHRDKVRDKAAAEEKRHGELLDNLALIVTEAEATNGNLIDVEMAIVSVFGNTGTMVGSLAGINDSIHALNISNESRAKDMQRTIVDLMGLIIVLNIMVFVGVGIMAFRG